MPFISVVTGCYNEEGNVRELYRAGRRSIADAARLTLRAPVHRQRLDRRHRRDPARARRRGQARQGHRQHAQLRPHPLALPRLAAGARRCGHRASSPTCRTPRADPRVRREVGGGLQGRHRRARTASEESPLMCWPCEVLLLGWSTASPMCRSSTTSPASACTTGRSWTSSADGRAVPVLPRAWSATSGYERAEIRYFQPAASAASPRTTSTASTTWRCWASRTTPRCRCAWPRWPAFCLAVLSLVVVGHLPGRQAHVLEQASDRHGAAADRHLLLRRRAAVLHRHPRRVHRRRSTPRSTSARWSWRRSASISTEAGELARATPAALRAAAAAGHGHRGPGRDRARFRLAAPVSGRRPDRRGLHGRGALPLRARCAALRRRDEHPADGGVLRVPLRQALRGAARLDRHRAVHASPVPAWSSWSRASS